MFTSVIGERARVYIYIYIYTRAALDILACTKQACRVYIIVVSSGALCHTERTPRVCGVDMGRRAGYNNSRDGKKN